VKATPKRLECGFDVAGDKRLKQATMRHRLDVNQNMTASFNPANMVCYGCKARGPHSVIGGKDRIRLCWLYRTKTSRLYCSVRTMAPALQF
jgi:hypothetical protein